jgi:hypothetical protein
LSENSVSSEECAVLIEEWENFSSSGQTEDSEPGNQRKKYHERPVMTNPLVTALVLSAV